MANRYGNYDMNDLYFEIKNFLENNKLSDLMTIINDIIIEKEENEESNHN